MRRSRKDRKREGLVTLTPRVSESRSKEGSMTWFDCVCVRLSECRWKTRVLSLLCIVIGSTLSCHVLLLSCRFLFVLPCFFVSCSMATTTTTRRINRPAFHSYCIPLFSWQWWVFCWNGPLSWCRKEEKNKNGSFSLLLWFELNYVPWRSDDHREKWTQAYCSNAQWRDNQVCLLATMRHFEPWFSDGPDIVWTVEGRYPRQISVPMDGLMSKKEDKQTCVCCACVCVGKSMIMWVCGLEG